MKVLVLGATGFTGRRVVPALLENGHSVRCLIRRASNLSGLAGLDIERVTGDASDREEVLSAARDMDAAVVLVSPGSGLGPKLVDCFQRSSIDRCLFFSTTSIFQTLEEGDREFRLRAESAIRNSGLAWTIVRPTMIYGAPDDRNISRLLHYLMKRSWIPVPGSGNYLLQPVFADDLAHAVPQILERDSTSGRDYNLPGGQKLTFNEMIDLIGECLGRRIWKVHLPALPVIWGLRFLEGLKISAPLKSEQVCRLNEHKAYSLQPAQDDFGYRARSFREGVQEEVQILRRCKSKTANSRVKRPDWQR